MYASTDIKWLKNVKRDSGSDWAYMEFGAGDVFSLNWPKHLKSNAYKPKIGEVILLFQTIKKGLGFPAGTYITHLVTPLNTNVEEQNSSHPYTRRVGVIAKAEPAISTKSLPYKVYKASRGACCDINLVVSREKKVLTLHQKQSIIWDTFKNKNNNVQNFFNLIGNIPEEDEGLLEGRLKIELRQHKFYERNPLVVAQAKERAFAENRLKCEVCNFDFNIFYPGLGEGFIECHHKIPISNGIERKTKRDDLALVCSNCHRMLHRLYNGSFLSIEELSKILKKKNDAKR